MLVVVGVPGAGKSSVLNGLLKQRKDIKIINYGDEMLKVALKRGIIKSRDEFSNLPGLPVSIHLKIQDEIAKSLKDTERTVLDTHIVLRRKPVGFIPGLTPGLIKGIKIEGFVLIDAPSKEIFERATKDKTRKRQVTEEEIEETRSISKNFLTHYSATTGAPFYFIQNREGKVKEAIDQILNIIKDIGW